MELCTSSNILFERSSGDYVKVEKSLAYIAKAGYRFVDFCFVDQVFTPLPSPFLTENWEAWVKEIRKRADSLGLQIAQCHLPIRDFCAKKTHPRDTEETMRRAIEACSILGVRVGVLHPSTYISDRAQALLEKKKKFELSASAADLAEMEEALSRQIREDSLEKNVAYFKALSHFARRFDLDLAIENMWGEAESHIKRYCVRPDELIELIDTLDEAHVGICWDTMHGSYEQLDQREVLHQISDRLLALHISDEWGKNYIHRLPYTGRCAWSEVLDGLREIGFDGLFDFELQHYLLDRPESDWDKALRQSYELGSLMIQRIKG